MENGATDLPPGITEEQWAKHVERQRAIREASAEVLPGPMAEVFGVERPAICGLRVRPLVHYDFVILKRIESPLYRRMMAMARAENGTDGAHATGGANDGTAFSDEEGYEMVFQFTRPVREVMGVLERGREVFRRTAIEEIGCRCSVRGVQALIEACVVEFVRAASTAVEYEQEQSQDGSFFLSRKGQSGSTTGSGGGGVTCAG